MNLLPIKTDKSGDNTPRRRDSVYMTLMVFLIGVIITSGIVAGREGELVDAMKKQGLTVLETARQGEWRCVVGRKI